MAAAVAEAERLVVGILAAAHVENRANGRHERDRTHPAAFMGAVTPRLARRQAAAAPQVRLALFHLNFVGPEPRHHRDLHVRAWLVASRVVHLAWAAGNATTLARFGKGSTALGRFIAATKYSWNFGAIAVSTFSTRRITVSISVRAARLRSAILAPVPAALPTERTLAKSQSGIMPRVIAYFTSM